MSILRRSLLLGAAACVTAVGAAVATSADAAIAPKAGVLSMDDKGVLVFTAGGNVANDVSTIGTLDPILVLADASAPIKINKSAAKMCRPIVNTTKRVRCTGTSKQKINMVVNLGDRDDRHVAIAAYPDSPELVGEGHVVLTVHGGAGTDQLDATSSSAPVTFYGEDGRDLMAGGRQNDILDAGDTDVPGQTVIGNGGEDTCRGTSIIAESCEH